MHVLNPLFHSILWCLHLIYVKIHFSFNNIWLLTIPSSPLAIFQWITTPIFIKLSKFHSFILSCNSIIHPHPYSTTVSSNNQFNRLHLSLTHQLAFCEPYEYRIALKFALQIPCFGHLQLFAQFFNFARGLIVCWYYNYYWIRLERKLLQCNRQF